MRIANCAPVIHRRTAHRVSTDTHAGITDGVEVDNIRQVRHVRIEVVVLYDEVSCLIHQLALNPIQPLSQVFIGTSCNPVRRIRVRRTTGRRVVLKTTIPWRIVGRGNHDAVGTRGATPRRTALHVAVVRQNRVADSRSRRVAILRVNHHGDAVGREHLEGGNHCRLGQAVGIAANVQWAFNALALAVIHDGLSGGVNVVFVESAVEGGTAVTGSTEDDLLVGVIRVRVLCVVSSDQFRDIDKVGWLGQLPGALMSHCGYPPAESANCATTDFTADQPAGMGKPNLDALPSLQCPRFRDSAHGKNYSVRQTRPCNRVQ